MLVLFHARGMKENHHIAYHQFNGKYSWHNDSLSTKVTSCDFSSVEDTSYYYTVSYLGYQFSSLSEDSSPPLVWTMITMSLHSPINYITYPHKLRRYFQCSILIHLNECNFIILISQYSDKEFEDVKRCNFDSGCKPKGV